MITNRSELSSGHESGAMRKIIHVDMDAYYASVEQRDLPQLRGRPVIVGGRPNGRGVVAACSYEARVFGIHSAMASAEAARRCPQAMFVTPRFEVYREVSQQIHQVFREFTECIEPLSLDEAYLDVTNSPNCGGLAMRMAREIKRRILDRTALVASAGVSYNKFLAKIASDHRKPDGLFCVLPEDGAEFVASLPIGRFYGVGPATEARMHALGIRTGADLRAWSLPELRVEFGKSADYYHGAARGIDERPVRASRHRKSLGSETTFEENLIEPRDMLEVLEHLSTQVLGDLQARELRGSALTIKVRFASFESVTRGHSHAAGWLDSRQVQRLLPYLLERAIGERQRPSVRLLGVTISGLSPADDVPPAQLELEF